MKKSIPWLFIGGGSGFIFQTLQGEFGWRLTIKLFIGLIVLFIGLIKYIQFKSKI